MSRTAAFLSGSRTPCARPRPESATGSPETWRKTLTFMPKRPVARALVEADAPTTSAAEDIAAIEAWRASRC